MQDWQRYTCQMALPGFEQGAQEKLAKAKVLIVGAGGLGCPVAQYLAGTGIGNITIIDHDVVAAKNLHRQILYTPADEGKKKATVAVERLRAQNPDINIKAITEAVTIDNVQQLIAGHDITVDCTDNFDARYMLNDASVLLGKPLVYGAIYQYEGQVAAWNIKNEDGSFSPNYRDLYPDVNAAAVPNCADGGVLPTVAGMVGMMQANEVIKYITGVGNLLSGKLLTLDVRTMRTHIWKLGDKTKTYIQAIHVPTTVQEISIDELQTAPGNYYLIDVRTDEERREYNIGGQHIELSKIEAAELNTNLPIVCYCATGKRSNEAAKLLLKKYPGNPVYNLSGGIQARKP